MSSHSLPHHMAPCASSLDSHFLDPQMSLIVSEVMACPVEKLLLQVSFPLPFKTS